MLSIFTFSYEIFAKKKIGIELDEELEEESQRNKNKGEILKENIDVEGENDQILKSQKKEGNAVIPSKTEMLDWDEPADEILGAQRKKNRQIERSANLRLLYGTFNSLDLGINISKKDRYGIYFFDYKRVGSDNEGSLQQAVNNSKKSNDVLKLIGDFSLSQSVRLRVDLDYYSSTVGLQQNNNYISQGKRMGSFMTNAFFLGDNQRLNWKVEGNYADGFIDSLTNPELNNFYKEISSTVDWQYIFSLNNTMTASLDLSYADMTNYGSDEKNLYKQGRFQLWNSFPLISSVDPTSNSTWLVTMGLGIDLFFAENYQLNAGPIFFINSIYNSYQSKLKLRRSGGIPLYDKEILVHGYRAPQYFDKANDYWEASWVNKVAFSKKSSLSVTGGYSYLGNFPELQFDNLGLYSFNQKLVRKAYGSLEWQLYTWGNFLLNLGATYNHYFDKVNLMPKIESKVELQWSLKSVMWKTQLTYFDNLTEYTGFAYTTQKDVSRYFIWDMNFEFKLNRTLSIKLDGKNLLNENYTRNANYRESGLRVFTGFQILI